MFTCIISTSFNCVQICSSHIQINICPAIVVLYLYKGSYKNDVSSPVLPYVSFVILEVFYLLILTLTYSCKLGVHFHPNKLGVGHSWANYIYSLPTLYDVD